MRKKYKQIWCIELAVIVILGITYFLTRNTPFSRCFIHDYLNILCPTCGATRCVISFLKLNWIVAFKYNPIIFLTIIYFIILNIVILINYITKKERLKWMFPSEKKFVIYALILFVYGIARNIF